ncbi:MAG: chemotaxis protein CheA [Burkholderiales bacterium]|nr:chemotaxis protein CheA [Burkholderiales bacterium]
MTSDMSQFFQVFFEETAEHLNEMERLLLGLDIASPSQEDLNAIFRAAHSIKGNSGTFGFTDMTEVTHILESLLDRVRKNEISLRSAMIDVFLEAVDVLRGQLDGHQHGSEVDREAASVVSAKLHKLTDAEQSEPLFSRRFHILFSPSALTLAGIRMENLLADLKRLGNLEVSGEENRWNFTLETNSGKDAIEEIFSFFAQSGETEISEEELGYGFFEPPEHEQDPGYGFFEPLPEVKQEDPGYGFFVEIPEKPVEAPKQEEHAPPAEVNWGRRATDKVPGAETASIRVGIDKVDQLINLVGELVITQAMLAQTARGLDEAMSDRLSNGLSQLERNTRDLQESVMSIRMMPISFVFSRFPRLVRDLATKLGKEVELVTVGEGTELDKGLIEKITDPLTHLVRNSLDHGIETPEKRIAQGKPAQGRITLEAAHQGGNIVISVSDDGMGLAREKILAKAKEKGFEVSEAMPDQEIWQLVFAPGFSTADVVTDVSGRGVGMDVVKKNINAMNGKVEIDSFAGKGSRVTIRLPLTLAILDGMSLAVGGQTFILPLAFITESLQPRPSEIKTVAGKGRLVHVRGEYIPLIALHQIFGIEPKVHEIHQGIVILIEAEGRKVALLVDELLGQHQVVIKALETNYRKVDCISAATIMGDGTVALILDVGALVKITQN